ncbi:hypothetical protein A2609_02365 [Candidatus Kaiserbacteria bacterium RIFOXYD1_FULL_47_14]|uniref:Uncharacterized protein n=1 Tax=Candidatus Kaiserbacteria bacterium RIFOXYD1_FULL_47_14 TaxID=1798533 RepID=A0A1F6G765_9BACT|nr:MAG: hypothetical protein A2609_02365 [Candidatus Kaiserbacteria bacterium RIFOXYD1_FULL_47_14]
MPFIYAVLILLAAFFLIIGIRIFNSTKFVGTDAGIGKIISSFTLKGVFTVLFIISGITIFFWKLYTPGLQSSQVGSWSWNRWPWILVLWGIGYGLIAFNAKTLGKATGTLQNILTTVAISLLVLGLFTSQCSGPRTVPATQANTTSTTIPLASAPIAEWPTLTIPAAGKLELIAPPHGMHVMVYGHNANLHTVYADGHESVIPIESDGSNPDGPVVKEYLTNRVNEINIVSVAYSTKK